MYSLVAHYENLKNLGYWIGCEIYIDWLIIRSFLSHGWAAINVKACYDICRVYIWQPQLESKNLRIFFFGSYIENDLVGSSNFSTILIFVIRCSVKNQNFHLYATCLLVRSSWSWRGYVISLSWCLWWQTGVDALGSIFYWVSLCQLTVNEFVELHICHGLALLSCFSNITWRVSGLCVCCG